MSRELGETTSDNSKKTLLTIIVPTYNGEAYFEEGLNSILEQMPEDYELIVVDDGSSDGTREKLAGYEGRQANLRICLADHRGASGARNIGLDLARGEYVAFMDCDDCLQKGFLQRSRSLLLKGAALCIFGIERVLLDGSSEFWTVPDRAYPSVSDFADDYIRVRKLLVYSNCNKFYCRRIIENGRIRFEEGISFGEDRLFNYRYLSECGRVGEADTDATDVGTAGTGVITSPMIMLRYLQRSEASMSTGPVSRSREQLMRLHREKMNCFLGLSRGTTEKERQDFENYDFKKEFGTKK